MTFEVEISRTDWSNGEGWTTASAALRERVYGAVRVRVELSAMGEDRPSVRVPVEVIDGRPGGDARDLPAFVELFFHDLFLLMNFAAPGSFGGTIAVGRRELTLEPRLFLYAGLDPRPLGDVVAWYDSLGIGTKQVADDGVTRALFTLLRLSSGTEDDATTVLGLAGALEAVGLSSEKLFALRDELVAGRAPVVHPLHDETLDPRLEEERFDWSPAVDEAAALLLRTLRAK